MRIALVGSSHAGKTSLAKALRDEGWYYANYTDLLKHVALAALHGAYEVLAIDGVVRMQDLIDNKKFYRPLLNELGTVLGFDKGEGVDLVLANWAAKGSPEPIVWDNVRFEAQAEKLRELGFVMVGLCADSEVLWDRAHKCGVTYDEFWKQYTWDEKNLPEADIILDGEHPTSELAEILNRLSGVRSYAKVS